MRVISFGGGVQSTALAILAAQRKIKVDAFVFCDTGFEQSIVFEFLDQHTKPLLDKAGVPFYTAKTQDYAGQLHGKSTFANWLLPPFFHKSLEKINYIKKREYLCNCENSELLMVDNYEFEHKNDCEFIEESDADFYERTINFRQQSNAVGRQPAYCSSKWKADVFKRFCASKFNSKKYDVIMGFSTDEMNRSARMKSTKKYTYQFPLLDLRMNRGDCVKLVQDTFNAPPPRSSCYFCPNHTQHEWRKVMESADRQKVIDIDKLIRQSVNDDLKDVNMYLTAECKPIAECEFDDKNEVIFSRLCSGGCFL